MKALLVLALGLAGALAQADIRRPQPKVEGDKMEVLGEAARELYDSLSGSSVTDLRGDSLRTYISTYRVFEPEDMLARIVCKKSHPKNDEPTYTCVMETSRDGRKLTKFVPRRRLG